MSGEITIQTLRDDWQRAVREHEQVARDARQRGLSPQEFNRIARAYLMRIDVAYSRLKFAEAAHTTG